MSDNKKYYYLKLKENFFETDEMIVLESMQDGYLYSNILLKLYLRSLKNDGKLIFNNRIPFNSTMLAQVTRMNVGVVEKAVQLFGELNLIEVLDNGAIYMSDIQNYIGKSTTEADRKRLYRAKIDQEKKSIQRKSDKCPDKNPPELELELEDYTNWDALFCLQEVDKEKRKSKNKRSYTQKPRTKNKLTAHNTVRPLLEDQNNTSTHSTHNFGVPKFVPNSDGIEI